MNKPSKPLAYLMLGASGSGRREIIYDLIEGGVGEGAHSHILLSQIDEDPQFEAKVSQLPNVSLSRWKRESDALLTPPLPLATTHVFFQTDGRSNPVDQIEIFPQWLQSNDVELGRIICVVDCQLAEKHPALLVWYEACIHFADVVLLNRREGVANKWISDFQRHFEDQYYPCLFEFIKAGRVKNPALLLEPEARRLSQVFDKRDDFITADLEIGIENEEGEETLTAEEEQERKYEELTPPEEDLYLARKNGGYRMKVIPDIAKYLSGR